jgi:peptide/nickel transport system permease protein
VQAARAKGASEARVLRRHVLPNALPPLVTMVGMDVGTALGIAVYVETVYGLPGLGRTLIFALDGIVGFDLPVILGVVVFTGVAVIGLNLLADLAAALLDPRVREARAV